jgi:hypothetical protein
VKLPPQLSVRRKWDDLASELRRIEEEARGLLVNDVRRGPVAKIMFKAITSLRKARYEAEKMADQERDR